MSLHEIVVTVSLDEEDREDDIAHLLRAARTAAAALNTVPGVLALEWEVRPPSGEPEDPTPAEHPARPSAAPTASLIDTRRGASVTRKEPARADVMPDAPPPEELEDYREHMIDVGEDPMLRNSREVGFTEGWTRAYYVATNPADG